MKTFNVKELRRIKFHPLPYAHITPSDVDAESYKRGWNDAVNSIMENASTLTLVKTGNWVDESDGVYCSECGEREDYRRYYCPSCGAKMEGGDAE